MSKPNAARQPSQGKSGFGSQRFVDPLTFVDSRKAAAPTTTWMLDPANEGNDHINIHSDSCHPLGRWFNPRATQPFPMGTLGSFNTIEAYMYFLLANSMRITEPDVIARVDTMRQASSVMLGGATAHLPNDLRQAYAHTYRLPPEIYKNIISYVADAYMSKMYELTAAQGNVDLLDTQIVQDILGNRLPYFGYYVNNGVTMNVSQRTTIISAIKLLEKRLREMMVERKRVDSSPMKVALLKAGVKTAALETPIAGNIPLGLSIAGVPATIEALEQFRAESEQDLQFHREESAVEAATATASYFQVKVPLSVDVAEIDVVVSEQDILAEEAQAAQEELDSTVVHVVG